MKLRWNAENEARGRQYHLERKLNVSFHRDRHRLPAGDFLCDLAVDHLAVVLLKHLHRGAHIAGNQIRASLFREPLSRIKVTERVN